MRASLIVAVVGLGVSLAGCRASVQASASASGKDKDGKEVADYDKPLSAQQRQQQQEHGAANVQYALNGARHDLNYAATPEETCQCLAVAVGRPSDARFSWEAVVPVLDDPTQLVIALTSQGIACAKAKKNSLGASYQGYEIDGQNVIVIVEAAHSGRPLTSGGIVPRPAGGGALYVRPAEPTLPYGKSTTGEPRCRVPLSTPSSAEPVNTDELFSRPFKSKALKSADEEDEATPPATP